MAKNNRNSKPTLGEWIALEMLYRYGGPMKLNAILAALQKRGLDPEKGDVVRAMVDDPERFRRTSYGMYALNPGLVRLEEGERL